MKRVIITLLIVLFVLFLFIEKGSGPNVSQNGISIHQLADDIFRKYDVNNDSLLFVNEESFLRVAIKSVTKTESHGLLFTDADTYGDGNGILDQNELENFLETFDKDNDGELTTFKNVIHSLLNKSEWYYFNEKYGEKEKFEER